MSEEKGGRERTPRKLVYQAHKAAAEERQRVNAAPYVSDDILDTQYIEVEYHAAIMEYFSRLKPHLPDRPEFWDEVPLYNEPLDGQRREIARDFAQYYGIEEHQALKLFDGLENNENFQAIQPQEDATVRGLKNLVHWRGRTEIVEETREDVIDGEVTEVIEKPLHLPRDVAMRVHDALDAAAADLGYNVRPGREIVKTNLDGESGEYEVEGVTTTE